MIINASNIHEITQFAKNDGIVCEERLDLGGITQPVILSDLTDPRAEVANTLSSQGVPVLYVAYQAPVNLSSMVTVLSGEEVSWSAIKQWITVSLEKVNQQVQIANLSVKRTIGVFGIQPGVGAGSIARGLSLYSARKGKKTLYIDLNYRYPKAPFLIGYKGNSLEELLETLISKSKPVMESYFLHKSKMQQLTRQQLEHFKTLPDDFYVISPSGELGLEYFPSVGDDLDEATTLLKKIVEGAKPYFETIVLSMGSDPDDIVNLAALRACDQSLFVIDTNPSSVYLFPQRFKLLQDSGVPVEGAQVVLTKTLPNVEKESIEKLIGQPISVTVPYDPDFMKELNHLNLMGGSAFQKGIAELASEVLGIEAEQKKSGGFLKSWGFGKTKASVL